MPFPNSPQVRSSIAENARAVSLVRLAAAAGVLACLAAAPAAHAQLFKDEEIYKRVQQLDAQRAADVRRIEAAETRAEQQARSLVELNQSIDALRQEIARLRGQIEVLSNDLENAQKRQRDFYTDLDGRIRKIEPPPPPAPGEKPKPPTADEQRVYDTALNQVKTSNFKGALDAFAAFVRQYPNSMLTPSAQYWIGNSHFALRDFKAAITAQQRVIDVWPEDAKAPDALLNISSAHIELKDNRAARATLEDLMKRYPQSEAAATAKQRIARIPR
jgi:tol-pal system protein YbgF